MLTASEAAGLNIHKLNPQLKQAIAQIAENRPVVVYKTAPVLLNSGSNPYVALTYTFQPYELSFGDQVRMTLWGQAINNNAGAVALASSTTVTNNLSGTVQIGAVSSSIAAAAGNPNAYVQFRIDCLFSVGVPGAVQPAQNYIPAINATQAATNTSVYATEDQPLNIFALFGGCYGFVTTAAGSGAVVVGGPLSATTQSLGMRSQIAMDNSVGTNISLNVSAGNLATFPVTIMAGSIEVL